MKTINYMGRPLFAIFASATLLFVSSASAQNVGIGTPSPASKLTVNGNLAVGGSAYNVAAPTNGAIIEGKVGIGTTTPFAPLHVGASSNFNFANSSNTTYFNYGNNNTTGFTLQTFAPSQAQPASAIFANDIWTNGSLVSASGTFAAASDARLKNIIGRSDSAKDLETLEKIEITDYTMKDVIKFGNNPFKKVIAQQVEKVYPTAVNSGGVKGFTFTPDIYAVSESVKMDKLDVYTIRLAKAHGLKDGNTVRLITLKNPELNAVAHIVNDKTFTVETKEPLGDKVFVYGKECTDLKTVDYDAISMLNVSATQELAKKVTTLEQENSDLQDQTKRLTVTEEKEKAEQQAKIAELEAKVASLEATNAKLTAIVAKVERLEHAVNGLQTKTAPHPVALNQ